MFIKSAGFVLQWQRRKHPAKYSQQKLSALQMFRCVFMIYSQKTAEISAAIILGSVSWRRCYVINGSEQQAMKNLIDCSIGIIKEQVFP